MSLLTTLLAPPLKALLRWMSRKRLPRTQGELRLAGLHGPVEVIRDRWGVPHIYAQDAQDLFFAQGYVHAQDRLLQMDIARRLALGRLSELFGEMALETDRLVRTFGLGRIARQEWAAYDADLRGLLEAYTAGVNAFLHGPEALEVAYTLLRHTPEDWHPEHSLAIVRLLVWELSHGWQGELVRAELAEAVGPEHAALWEPHYPAANPITLPQGIVFHRLDPDGRLHRLPGPFLHRGQGSNVWAIAATRSATGGPVLANDMHLRAGVPGVWYENHLEAGDFRVTGVSVAGVPLVLVGHNAHIGWGMTLAYTDAEDLFVERFDPAQPTRYLYKDQWLEAEVVREVIQVKGRAEPVVEEVLLTRHGPVISPVTPYGPTLHQVEGAFVERLAVCSMALRPGEAIRGWWLLNQAQNWDAFVEAMRYIEAPQLNVGYADVEGNIGYWVTGKVPIRGKGNGKVPVPGWTGEYDWVGEVPFEEMPHALNPEQGYLVNTNNKIVPDDYPYFLGDIWMNGYRARRIEQMLTAKERLTLDDHAAMQVDLTSLPGQEFVAALADFQSDDPEVQLALRLLREWDGQLTPDTVGGTVYEVARTVLVRRLLRAAVDEDLANRVLGQGFHPLTFYASEFYGHDVTVLLRLLREPDNWWVQQAGGYEAWLNQGLREAIIWLRETLGPTPQDWRWGRLHRLPLEHLLGSQPPLDAVFNLPPLTVGGDTDTPLQTAVLPQEPYENRSFVPSHRQIFDLRQWDNSRMVILPGQSGRLASPHYNDQVELWQQGRHHPLLWSRERVEAHAEGHLTLRP